MVSKPLEHATAYVIAEVNVCHGDVGRARAVAQCLHETVPFEIIGDVANARQKNHELRMTGVIESQHIQGLDCRHQRVQRRIPPDESAQRSAP